MIIDSILVRKPGHPPIEARRHVVPVWKRQILGPGGPHPSEKKVGVLILSHSLFPHTLFVANAVLNETQDSIGQQPVRLHFDGQDTKILGFIEPGHL